MTQTANDQRANHPEVRLHDETIEFLKTEIAEAVKAGIKGAINEDAARQFWGTGFKVLQEQATQHTGRFVLGGLWGLVRKGMLFLVAGYVVYLIGGWAAVAKFWATVKGVA
jgi:hypothetical protein